MPFVIHFYTNRCHTRSVAGGVGILAGVSQLVSHWGELRVARNHGGTDCTKSGRPVDPVWQVSTAQPAAVVSTGLGVESDDGGCRGDGN